MGLFEPHGRHRRCDGGVSLNGESVSVQGIVAGIARHAHSRAPMEEIGRVAITPERGVDGDCKGAIRPGKRNRRQVTLIERADWDAAMAQLGARHAWSARRANILVDGIDLPQTPGSVLCIGTVRLLVTVECEPCQRMDEIEPGLQAALRIDWRGGVCTRVLTGGEIALGDAIIVEAGHVEQVMEILA